MSRTQCVAKPTACKQHLPITGRSALVPLTKPPHRFMLAFRQVHALSGCTTIKELKAVLQDLPATVEDTYERFLERRLAENPQRTRAMLT